MAKFYDEQDILKAINEHVPDDKKDIIFDLLDKLPYIEKKDTDRSVKDITKEALEQLNRIEDVTNFKRVLEGLKGLLYELQMTSNMELNNELIENHALKQKVKDLTYLLNNKKIKHEFVAQDACMLYDEIFNLPNDNTNNIDLDSLQTNDDFLAEFDSKMEESMEISIEDVLNCYFRGKEVQNYDNYGLTSEYYYSKDQIFAALRKISYANLLVEILNDETFINKKNKGYKYSNQYLYNMELLKDMYYKINNFSYYDYYNTNYSTNFDTSTNNLNNINDLSGQYYNSNSTGD